MKFDMTNLVWLGVDLWGVSKITTSDRTDIEQASE